jgi:type III secretory pathway component EscT
MIKNSFIIKILVVAFFVSSFLIGISSVSAQTNTTPNQPVFSGASDPSSCNLGATGSTFTTFTECIVDTIISIIVPFLFAIALIAFSIGVLNYVKNADNESKRSESLQLIIWSLIGLFFMVSVWAFSGMVADFLGVTGATSDLKIPQIKDN